MANLLGFWYGFESDFLSTDMSNYSMDGGWGCLSETEMGFQMELELGEDLD